MTARPRSPSTSCLSDDIANTDADVRDSAFEVTGGSVTGVGRVDGRSDLWEITVTPDGSGNIGIVLLADRACGTPGALCTADGRALTTALLVTVPANPQQAALGGPDALTAEFADMPAEHGGATEFTFELRFSESFPISYLTMRDEAFTVTNARITRARRLDNPHNEQQGMQPNREWEITVAPDAGAGDVTITLPRDHRLRGDGGGLHRGRDDAVGRGLGDCAAHLRRSERGAAAAALACELRERARGA